jgi:hypothetical protein
MALSQHPVDVVPGLLAITGRKAGTERRLEPEAWLGGPPGLPAGQTPGLAGQAVERHPDRFETAKKRPGIDRVVWLGRRALNRPWLKQGDERACVKEVNAGAHFRILPPNPVEALAGVKQRE